nr:major pollen allergen Ole e 6-like [Quercus suber]XP_023897053.1 major pollen allergen Ole e 6-like [Quercus suber]
MANKFVAVFLMCIVAVAAFSLQAAKAAEEDMFKGCFSKCHKGCLLNRNGNSFCEMKCDNDCAEKELAEKLNTNLP